MKYLFATLGAMAVIFSLGYLLARLMLKKASSAPRKGRTLLLTVLNGMAILLLAGAACKGDGEAAVSAREQRAATADAIASLY